MKVRVVVGVLASIASACGAGRDEPTAITVVTNQPPALIAYREEATADWKTPTRPGADRYELEVAGPYRVIVVCEDSGLVVVVQLARTLDDEHSIELTCREPPGPRFFVHGQMLQPGMVTFELSGLVHSTAPWSFVTFTAAGTFDLVAFSGDESTGFDHFEIRRDITVTADQDLGTIDVAQVPAQALIPTRFTATNLAASESSVAYVELVSGNTHAAALTTTQPEHAWQVGLVPGAALRSTDIQAVHLAARASLSGQPMSGQPMQQSTREIIRRIRDGGSTLVTLMDAIGPTRFESTADRLVATWASLPECDRIAVSRQSFSSSHFVVQSFRISHAFIASTGTGATSVALDFTDVPGFRPEWRHDPTLEQEFAVWASRGTSPDDYTSSEVAELVPAPSPIGAGTAPRGIDAQRAMARGAGRAAVSLPKARSLRGGSE
jgi:hypothetical protein